MALRAEGFGVTLIVEEEKVIIEKKGGLSVLRQGAKIYGDPTVLSGALDGPSRNVILNSHSGSRDLLGAIVRPYATQT